MRSLGRRVRVRSGSRGLRAAVALTLGTVLTVGQPVGSLEAASRQGEATRVDDTPQSLAEAVTATVNAALALTQAAPRGSDPTGVTALRARWAWPLLMPEVVVNRFDGPAQRWLPGHRGVDLAGFEGAPVRAVADGVVSFRGVINGVGVISVIHPDGVLSTYQPVVATLSKGQQVRTGTTIGTLAAQGSHCWPLVCLHLGARRDKQYLDPMMFLRPWVVSLLPPRVN